MMVLVEMNIDSRSWSAFLPRMLNLYIQAVKRNITHLSVNATVRVVNVIVPLLILFSSRLIG